MSDKLNESLSALMDGESDELEMRRLLKEMEVDSALYSTWSRYHIASEVMQRNVPVNVLKTDVLKTDVLRMDISANLRGAIAGEPLHGQPGSDSRSLLQARIPNRWLKPFAGMAVAASVAVVTIIGVKGLSPAGMVENPTVASMGREVNQTVMSAAQLNTPASSGLRYVGANVVSRGGENTASYVIPASLAKGRVALAEDIRQARRNQHFTQQRLDEFMLRHSEQASWNNSQGMLPMARVASFPVE